MRAVVLKQYGEPPAVEQKPEPNCSPDGVVIELEACGVCRSDWHAWQGDWAWVGARPGRGQILGHEPAGRVAVAGTDAPFEAGDRVTVPFNVGDGTCPMCRRGHGNVCENTTPLGFALPGAFAERVHVPAAAHNVVRLPDEVAARDAAGLGCRFVTAFHALTDRVDLDAGDWLAVHGCGGVGLSAVHVADALGANVVAVDIDEDALARARDLGAVETVDASDEERVPRAVKSLTDGGAHVSMDALGIAGTCRNSVECLRRRGTHLQVGLTTGEEGGEVSIPVDAMTMAEQTFETAFGMPPTRYDALFRMIVHGSLDPGVVVSGEIGLDEVPGTLAAMGEYDTAGIPVVTEF